MSKRAPEVGISSNKSSADVVVENIHGGMDEGMGEERRSNSRTNGRVSKQIQQPQQQQQVQQKQSIAVEDQKIAAFKRRIYIDKRFKLGDFVATKLPGGEVDQLVNMRYTIGTDSEAKEVLNYYKAMINGQLCGDLSATVILAVKLVNYRNTLPYPIGIRLVGIADVPAKVTYAKTGTTFSMILPAESQEIFTKKKILYNKSELLNSLTARNISINSLTKETLNAQLYPVHDRPDLLLVYPNTEVGKVLHKDCNQKYLHIGQEMAEGMKNKLGAPVAIEKEITDVIVGELVAACEGVKTTDLRTFGIEFCNLNDANSSADGWTGIAKEAARYSEISNQLIMTEPQSIEAEIKIKYAIVSADMVSHNRQSSSAAAIQHQNPSAPP